MEEKDLLKKLGEIKTDSELLELLQTKPPETWIKTHPEITEYRYIQIERIEILLRTIFKMNYRTEIVEHKKLFNTVSVVVRVHFKQFDAPHSWLYFDGAAAEEPEKGKASSNLGEYEAYAVAKAFPSAKSNAIRNACLMFGPLFGNGLNRVDAKAEKPILKDADKLKKIKILFEELEERIPSKDYKNYLRIIEKEEKNSYDKAIRELELIKNKKH